MYLTSRSIPELSGLKYTQRAQIIRLALSYLSVPEKTVLNLIKLLFLTPIFLILARIDSWEILIYLLITGICYPLITNPISIYFAKKYIDKAKAEFLDR
ncbi:DUF6170 family protein [Pseudoalteromonas denitrificans]|uniref:Uncharacterized protein n=1 Tax=Pseudoalteromonas denitrificans DSM 6059 TaxID=1123010 RepID=A0A1I1TW90_9GAMM|nr:DUF6170 family protein [Pseudoalteromonas denitrificans]SFD62655.1 hypothetical protein SAMN02745724_05016 [Pseudoalteromonas denitrificans DSM 6059]